MLVKHRPRVVRKDFVANVSKRKAPNPLRVDPTRTRMLRKRFEVEINRRYRRLRREINDLVLREDALGLAANYNPSQPRDAHGKWSSVGGGGGGGGVEVPTKDIKDAKKVLKDWGHEYGVSWGDSNAGDEFDKALESATVESLEVAKLEVHHDWGRRPESDVPVIIARFYGGRSAVLDGQHRVLTAREKGKKKIRAVVLDIPLRRRSTGKGYYLTGNITGLAANYNPSQPRDAKGRWGSGGGGGGGGGGGEPTTEEKAALYEQHGSQYHQVNLALRSGQEGMASPEVKERIDQLDSLMEKSTIPVEVETVYRGRNHDPFARGVTKEVPMVEGSPEFGTVKRTVWEQSTEFTDRGFTSTSVSESTASGFGSHVLVIENPGGLRGVDVDRVLGKQAESEILLDRGSVFTRISSEQRGSKTYHRVRVSQATINIANQRWAFRSDTKKLKAFKVWLTMKFGKLLAEDEKDAYWDQYIEEGWKQGTGRAYADARPQLRWEAGEGDFYRGSKRQFMETAFATPVSRERVKLLAERAYTDLKGVTSDMGTRMARVLADGMIQGKNPRVVARDLDKELEIGRKRSLVIARTETVRAHNEGQLDAMELLGVEEVGVAVEWSTSGIGTTARGNPSPCPICAPLAKMVLTLREAHGILPRHANCMCSWVPANVGEDTEDQIRAKGEISKAIDRSIKAEAPKKRTLAEQRKRTRWGGADKVIRKKRPKELEPTE